MSDADFDQDPDSWSEFAPDWDAGYAAFTALFARDAVRLAGVRRGMRVLDVAAGTGAAAFAAAEVGAEAGAGEPVTVLATDFSQGMLDILQANARSRGLHSIEARLMDGQAMDTEKGAYDAAFSMFGLIFFPDRQAGYRGLLEALKPGGIAVVSAWGAEERLKFHRAIEEALLKAAPDFPKGEAPEHWAVLSDADRFGEDMLQAGFSRVNVFTVCHVYTFQSPESFWDGHIPKAPPLKKILAGLTSGQARDFRAAFIGGIRERQGDGPYGLESEAHLAVGVK